jgi:pyruvate formate lyase activating enzyme
VKFLVECLKLCKEKGIHTCIDTAGVGLGDYDEILKYCDLVILDIKAVDELEYKDLTGRDIGSFQNFLSQLKKSHCKVWIRQVIVPGINNTKDHVLALKEYVKSIPNVEKVELLPYRTMGVTKYKSLNIPYQLDGTPDLSQEELDYLNTFLEE